MSESTASLIRHDGRNGYQTREKLFIALCLAAVLLPVSLLVGLVGQLFVEGLGRLSWDFILSFPSRKAELAGILPAVVGSGPRRFRGEREPLVATAAIGFGDVAARSAGSMLDDRTSAVFLRAGVDAGNGIGLQAEVWSSDDDLFRGVMINDGVAPANAVVDGLMKASSQAFRSAQVSPQ